MDNLELLNYAQKKKLKGCQLCIASGIRTYNPFRGTTPCGYGNGEPDDIPSCPSKEECLEKLFNDLTSFEKVFWALYELKLYYLQAEYYGIKPVEMWGGKKGNLYPTIVSNIEKIKEQIGEDRLLDIENHQIFTQEKYADLYLNQIENPDIVTHNFNLLCKLLGYSQKGVYQLNLDYLFPAHINFKTEKERLNFAMTQDLGDYTNTTLKGGE